VRGRVGERADDPEQLDRRAGPAVREINGNAFSCRDRTWMKWTSSPSIPVLNCGSAFSLVSHARQSYSVAQ
jgi:hypothetical protein